MAAMNDATNRMGLRIARPDGPAPDLLLVPDLVRTKNALPEMPLLVRLPHAVVHQGWNAAGLAATLAWAALCSP
jgi:hypothetical protein